MKGSVISEPIFGSNVLFLHAIGTDEAKQTAERWFKKQGADMDLDFTGARAVTFDEGRNFVVWIRDACDVKSIVHEAIHVGISLMKAIGHDVTKGDEPLAYYCDWLVGEAMERL